MDESILDLLIIGAGPAGLSTAVHALHRGAKRVIVAEQSRELRPVGQQLDILPNGFRCLSALAPCMKPLLEPYIYVTPPGQVRGSNVSTSGRSLFDMQPSDYGQFASLRWWQLQKLLMNALPDRRIVVLNHQLADVMHEDGFVYAEFVVGRKRENAFKNWDGDEDQPESESVPREEENASHSMFEPVPGTGVNGERRVRVKAKVLVGADGINSVVRRCVYRDCNPAWEKYTDPIYSGFTRVGAWCGHDVEFDKDDERLIKDEYVRNSFMCFVTCEENKIGPSSPRGMILHRGKAWNRPASWIIGYFLAIDEPTIKTCSDEELTQVALGKLREVEFPEALLRLTERIWASDASSIWIRKHYTVPATHPLGFEKPETMPDRKYAENFERRWFHRRAIIIGDAAHAAPNFLAQGSAMSIEDAYILVGLLADSGVWTKGDDYVPSEQELGNVFEKYHSARLGRVWDFQEGTMVRRSEYDGERMRELEERLYGFEI